MAARRELSLYPVIQKYEGKLAENIDCYDLFLAGEIKRMKALARQLENLERSRRVSWEDMQKQFTI